ncbi:MAG: hypothetical protein F7B11_04595 [Caldisphaeraceae archaeon]|nr:hypothetical protein [Caldisphaeraceae archaeon]
MVILEIMQCLSNSLAGEQQHEPLKKLAREGSVVNVARKPRFLMRLFTCGRNENSDTRLSR